MIKKTGKDKLTVHFKQGQNSDLEDIKFRDMSQNEGETIDSFHTRLRQRAVNCEFPDVDQEIRCQILRRPKHKKLRTYTIEQPGKNITDILTYARALEVTEHTQYIGKADSSVKVSVNMMPHGQ